MKMNLLLVLAGLMLTACNSGYPDPVQSNPPNIIEKGSGGACPTFAIQYKCSLTNEEIRAGQTKYELGIVTATNKENQKVLVIGGAPFITDGEVHERTGSQANIKYSVDCQGSVVSIKAASTDGKKMMIVITKVNDTDLQMDVGGTANGQYRIEKRICKAETSS